MDELEISGKRYISSKRAGKEHNYHPDYIGQLIRAKKIEGQKVGRSWYVDEADLKKYLYETKEAPGISPDLGRFSDIGTTAAFPKEEKYIPHTSTLEKEIAEEEEVRKVSVNIQAISIDRSEAPSYRPTTSGLTYIADDRPLLPRIEKRNQAYQHSVPVAPVAISAQKPQARKATRKGFPIVFTVFWCLILTAGSTLASGALVSDVYLNTYQNVSTEHISFDWSYLASFTKAVKFE